MRNVTRRLIGAAALAAMGASALQLPASNPSATAAGGQAAAHPASAAGQPAAGQPATGQPAQSVADADRGAPPEAGNQPSHGQLRNPLAEDREARKRVALDQVLRGQTRLQSRGDSRVAKLGDGKYAELSAQRTDQVFTLLAQFGDQVDPRTGYDEPGPVHNEIPQPRRGRNNTTYWTDDFSREHYLDLLFSDQGESFQDYYETQSDGMYSVDGDVSAWVQLPFNGARYGSNDVPADDGYWSFVQDAADAWHEQQLDQGRTSEEVAQYLSRFDQRDRYDHNGNGDFNEPDGYLDNFQLVYAGEGEEAGGGVLGPDAIWSHRWYAFANLIGQAGPEGNLRGGVEIGDTGYWVGDYTAQPENGGLGVFAHEFGHNLGLPDLYDTAGGENGTGFWTIMSSGSWLGHGDDTIGTTPNGFDAWSKLQLGWLNYDIASPDRTSTHTIGTLTGDEHPQALIVPLPKQEVITEYNTPYSGQYEWWSGSGDDLNNTLRRTIDLTDATDSAQLTAKAWYDIETGYDNLYLEVSTDGGANWETLGDPVTGSSEGKWVDLDAELTPYLGEQVTFRFRYTTDGGVHYAGAMLDDLAVTVDGERAWFDDVEDGADDWDAVGWTIFDGSTREYKGTYYITENRQYDGYDATLETGPYHFGRARTRPDWVDHFPYQNGILIWQWDERQENNNTSQHPGEGLILPVDARSEALRWDNNAVVRNRLQAFDATFSAQATDALALSHERVVDGHTQLLFLDVPKQEPVTVFDDSEPQAYWDPANPQGSVHVAGYGVSIEVAESSADGTEKTLVVGPSDAR